MGKKEELAKYKAKQKLLGDNTLELELMTDLIGNETIEVVKYNEKGGIDDRVDIPNLVDSIANVNFEDRIVKIPKGRTDLLENLKVHPNYKMINLWIKLNELHTIDTSDIRLEWNSAVYRNELKNVKAIQVEDEADVMEILNNPYIGGTLIINGKTGEVIRSIANKAILSYYAIISTYPTATGVPDELTMMGIYMLNQRKNPDEYGILDELLQKTKLVRRTHGK